MKKGSRRIISGLFLLVFFASMLISTTNSIDNNSINNYTNDNLSLSGADDIVLDDLSIPFGTNIMQYRDYEFSGSVYDSSNVTKTLNESMIEYVYVNDPYITFNNTEAITGGQDIVYPDENTISSNSDYTQVDYTGDLVDLDNDMYQYTTETYMDYKGTYTFADQPIGTSNSAVNWIDYRQSSSSAYIVEEVDGHRNVLFVDNRYTMGHVFGAFTVGTIEMWFRTDKNTDFYFRQYNYNERLYAGRSGGVWRYGRTSSSTISTGVSASINTWYHFRWDFNNGLVDWYIDGELVADNYALNNEGGNYNIDRLHLGGELYRNCWIDSYSSTSEDPNYIIGSNKETLLNTKIYEATYSFTGEYDGNSPRAWEVDESGGSVNIISEIGEHHKVVEMIDGSATDIVNMSESIDNITKGTIEYWMMTNDTRTMNQFELLDDGVAKIGVRTFDNTFQYFDGSWNTISKIGVRVYNDTWYHIRVDFDCIIDRWHLYIDGIRCTDNIGYGVNFGNANDIDYVQFFTNDENRSIYYLDGIGYSWDISYQIGKNWRNQYYKGTYTFEEYGTQEIGDYNATYSFDDAWNYIGYDPFGWNLYEGGGSVNITSNLRNHRRIVELNDISTSDYVSMNNTFTNQIEGTVEFWVLTTDSSKHFGFYLYENDSCLVNISIEGGNFQYYDGSSVNTITSASSNVWYHVGIEFNCTSDDFNVYIDNILQGSGYSYCNLGDNINTLYFCTNDTYSGYSGYVDAVGYSWLDYNIGDNLYTELGEDWEITAGTDTNLFVSGRKDGYHSKVLQLSDIGTGSINVQNNFDTNRGHGSVKLYLMYDMFTWNNFIGVHVRSGTTTIAGIRNSYGYVRYTNGGGSYPYVPIAEDRPISNKWHCIQIDWCQDSSGWTGLSNMKARITLNGDGFTFNLAYGSYTNNLIIYSGGDFVSQIYADSLSYSWEDPINSMFEVNKNQTIDFTFEVDASSVDLSMVTQLDVNSYYYTDTSTYINLYVYNHTSTEWLLINNNTFTGTYGLANYSNDGFIDSISTIQSRGIYTFRVLCENITDTIKFKFDKFYLKFWKKYTISHTQSFVMLGLWKYRVHLTYEGYTSDWIHFNVIVHSDNIEIVTESDYTTQWQVIDDSIPSGTLRFEDNLKSGRWDLYGMSDRIITHSFVPPYQVGISSSNPDTNYGSAEYFGFGTVFIGYPSIDYFVDNTTNHAESTLRGQSSYSISPDPILDVYKCDPFDEYAVTYNNQPNVTAYRGSKTASVGTYLTVTFGLGYNFDNYYKITRTGGGGFQIWSEDQAYWLKPTITYHIPKNYHNTTKGYMYMQTDTSELLRLRSSNYGINTVLAGDFFTIDLQSTASDIIMELIYDGEIVKTMNVLTNNVNFDNQTVEMIVNEDVMFDQIQFSGVLTDKEYFKCYNIKAEGFPITQDIHEYYIAPYGQESDYLPVGNYTVKVYEKDILRLHQSVQLDHDLKTIIFERNIPNQVYINYYDVNNDMLNFDDYKTYVDYTLNDLDYYNVRLSENFLYVDDGSYVRISTFDSFNNSVSDMVYLEQNFIDLELDVYSLKIKNEATENVLFTLRNRDSGYEKDEVLFSGEITEYIIASGNYKLSYINQEDNYPREFNFTFTSNKLIRINTTYHEVYFSIFTYDGLGIDHDLVRFYINDERRDFGFNTIQSETANLVVKDFFNNTLAEEVIDASAFSEYNIFIEIYSLIVLNQFTYEDIVVNITQVGSGVWMTQIIPKQFGFTYRFLPTVDYNITIFFTNATFYNSRIVNLTTNNHIESFGIPTGMQEYPKDIYFGVYTTGGQSIDEDLFKFYIDGDRADFGFNRIEDMIITITVRDIFDSIIFNQMINTSGIYEYDILIDTYSLKIKNEATQLVDYILRFSSFYENGTIIPQEIVEYELSSGGYVLEYINNEDGSNRSVSFTLNKDKVIIINTTYFDVYFASFLSDGNGFNYESVRFYINNERKDFGFNTMSQEVNNLKILDRFGTVLYNEDVNLKGYTEYNMFINLFKLKIESQCYEIVNYTIIRNGMNDTGIIMTDEIIEYLISVGNYEFYYTNHENMKTSLIDITIDGDHWITIESVYDEIYFSVFTYDGLGIDRDMVKFYINGSRKDFGFNIIESDYVELTILDYFNTELYNEIVYCRNETEISMLVEIYTLSINNLFNTETIIVNITQDGSGVWLTQLISAQQNIPFRLKAHADYTVIGIYREIVDERNVELDVNGKIVNFGFYEQPVADVPEFNEEISDWVMVTILVSGTIIGAIAVVLGLRSFALKKRTNKYFRFNNQGKIF